MVHGKPGNPVYLNLTMLDFLVVFRSPARFIFV